MRLAHARRRPEESDTRSPIATIVRVVRAAQLHRTTGHAAEMAFFAVLTLVPSTVAVPACRCVSVESDRGARQLAVPMQ